jgi:amidase
MLLAQDPVGAFVDYPAREVEPNAGGPLAGLTFAAKDLFDVAGYPTGSGHPLLRSQSGLKAVSAPAVSMLLEAGARFVGKTHTDEFAYSMNGENPHYGTPVNVRAPGRIPGGSSSGSAAAVAAGLVDIALGTDTGGSVRLPASYCGLIGLRTTHGRISLAGIHPLASTFDTVGWFARTSGIYQEVGAVLLGPDGGSPSLRRMVVAEDICAMVLGEAEHGAFRSALPALKGRMADGGSLTLAGGRLEHWRLAFRTMQAFEAWAAHGAWIERWKPAFGEGVRERFELARSTTLEAYEAARRERAEITDRVLSVLRDDTVIAIPTGPAPAPLLGMSGDGLESYRVRATSMLCAAGLAGVPQISLPLAEVDGCPFGISLVGPRGSDRALIGLARSLL